MNKCLIVLLACIAFVSTAEAQAYLSPQEKAVLDFYYAQAQSNSISGSWLAEGSVPATALETNVQVILSSSITNAVFNEAVSNFVETVGNTVSITFNTNYLTSYTETDPHFSSVSNNIFYNNQNNDAGGWSATNFFELGLTVGEFAILNGTQLVYKTSTATNPIVGDIFN